jgi:putative redox protein
VASVHEVHVSLAEGMHFEGVAFPSDESITIQLDAAEEAGGQGKGARPQSLVLVGLAGCTAMDVLSILRKKRQAVEGLTVQAKGEKAEEHPKVYTHIWLTYRVTGKDVAREAVERAIQLSIDKYCPVAGMLKQVVPIETAYEIILA